MKKLSLKSGCSLLIAVFGAVLPLSAAQAATQNDMGTGHLVERPAVGRFADDLLR